MSDEILSSKEQTFRSYLRTVGMKPTGERTLVLRVLLKTIKPISVLDLHYLAKAEDVKVSYHCVARTLKLIVASGLATEIRVGDITQYKHELAQCSHDHLIARTAVPPSPRKEAAARNLDIWPRLNAQRSILPRVRLNTTAFFQRPGAHKAKQISRTLSRPCTCGNP
jgi:hypothetical protein